MAEITYEIMGRYLSQQPKAETEVLDEANGLQERDHRIKTFAVALTIVGGGYLTIRILMGML